jgi:hypothetical protein
MGGSIARSTAGAEGEEDVIDAAGPVLTGEIDRARSMHVSEPSIAPATFVRTCSSGLTLLFGLHHLLLGFACPLRIIFGFSAEASNPSEELVDVF